MNLDEFRFPCIAIACCIGLSVMGACASRETSTALPAPIDIPLQPPREACVAPSAFDGVNTCQAYAHCCGEIVSDALPSCSFDRSDAGAECICVLQPGYEVRCHDDAGISCGCFRTPQ